VRNSLSDASCKQYLKGEDDPVTDVHHP
jgi:hypothetical protein